MTSFVRMGLGLLFSALLLVAAKNNSNEPIRVQLTTGGHPHGLSFYSIFNDQPDLAVTVNPHPSAFQTDLTGTTDVLVLYDLADADASGQEVLKHFLESGRGLVVLHHALADNQHWQWWYDEVVGGRYLMKPEQEQPASTYISNAVMKVHIVADNPVTTGLRDFEIRDEAYGHVWISPSVKPIAVTDYPGGMHVLAWISAYPKARVVYIELGHGSEAHANPSYRRLVHNAIVWAAGRS